jgi:flagellar M-ring protein FliF
MKQIEQLAQAAIGVDSQRGDLLAVENLSFQQEPVETPGPPNAAERLKHRIEPWTWALRYGGLAALFLVVYWLVLRPVTKQAAAAFRELPGKIAQRLAPPSPEAGELAENAGPEMGGKRAAQLKKLLAERVKAEPETTSRLVQGWIEQEEHR